jgi:uncharacterized protein
MRVFKFAIVMAATMAIGSVASAAILTTAGLPVVETFDTLAGTGTNVAATGGANPLPGAWKLLELPTSSTSSRLGDNYTANTGSDTASDTYSYGSGGSTDRALGSLASGSISDLRFGTTILNSTGSTLDSIAISLRAETWRNGSSTDDVANFQYSLDATSLNTGTWTDIDSLDLITDATLDPANTAATRNGNVDFVDLAGSISSLNLANGQSLWIRWVDLDSTGSDDARGIDDVSITGSVIPEPASLGAVVLAMSLIRRNRAR